MSLDRSFSGDSGLPSDQSSKIADKPPTKMAKNSDLRGSEGVLAPELKLKPELKPKQTPTLNPEQLLAKWLVLELKDVFHVTLDPQQLTNQLVYVESLHNEMSNDGRLINENDVESVFMEVLSEIGVPTQFQSSIDYLFHIYSKSFQLKRILSKKDDLYAKKIEIINSFINFSCSFGFICFQISDMFINNDLPLAIDLFITNHGSMTTFLIDIIHKSIEQEGLLDLLNLFMPTISSQLYRFNLNDTSYSKYLATFETFVSIKPVAAIFSQVNGFQPPNPEDGLDYEHKTLLGPLLRLSPLVDQVSNYYFGTNVNNMSSVQINSTYESLQNEYKVVADRLFFIVDKLIRGSAETRESLLQWFAKLINISHLRRGSHADTSKLASDGIMFNISLILIRLSLPFMDYPLFSKIDKIDINYIGKNRLLDFKDETRINSSIQDSVDYYNDQDLDLSTNFISDCFYLTMTYLHYGIGGIYVRHDRLKNQIKQLKDRLSMIENNQLPPGTNPMMLNYFKSQLPKLHEQMGLLKSQKHSIQAIFSYRNLQLEIFDFIIGATIFITRVIDPSKQHPKKKLSIPIFQVSKVSELDDQDFLRTKCPMPWKFYPEYFLEGIINYCKFTTNFRGSPLVNNFDKLLLFIEFSIILVRCPEVLGNPHMKSNIIEILFIGSLPLTDGSPGFLSTIFNSNEIVINNILYSLLDLYVMVEKTGASSQFYDKFNSRYYISVILEELWKNEVYRNQLTKYSVDNVDFFIRFIARMLNDTTYLLDETFNELNAIHNYQQELKKRQLGQEPNEEEYGNNDEIIKNLESSERKAKSYMGLSNKTMELFKLFTKEVPQGFVLPELVDRLAGMLDYNLATMVGPKCSNLKVEDPTKYDFNPRATLQDLCEIYHNLSKQNKFVKAVSKDGRSFNIKWFYKAEKILTTKTLSDPRMIKTLVEFAEKAENTRIEDENEELELGEIPDEFLDPLMFTLMEDPVILPGSRMSMDRSTIKAHLLSDPTDPFNRVPLKLEDVIDDIELKTKIENFKREKKSGKMEVD